MATVGGKRALATTLQDRLPPHLYFVGSAIFHYLGPSFAVLLFTRMLVAGVAWLRIVSAGVVFAVWRRPWRSFMAASQRTQGYIMALGGVFAVEELQLLHRHRSSAAGHGCRHRIYRDDTDELLRGRETVEPFARSELLGQFRSVAGSLVRILPVPANSRPGVRRRDQGCRPQQPALLLFSFLRLSRSSCETLALHTGSAPPLSASPIARPTVDL